MGIRDAQQLLDENRALTTGTVVSTNTIDLAKADNGFDIGEPMALEITVLVTAASGGTYQFNAVSSAAANLGSPTVLASRTIAAALLVAGSQHVIPLPPGAIAQRYLGGQYILGATTPGVTVTVHVVPMSFIERRKNYPDALTIS